MEVFEATKFDLHELAELFNGYRKFYGMPDDFESCYNFLSERMNKNDSIIYITRNDDDHAIAFAQLYPLLSSVHLKKLWLLNDLYVEPQSRKKGSARMLLDRCRQHAIETSAHGLMLETGKKNVEGNKLYPSAGYKVIDESNFYFLETASS